jgi:uncharacterized protein YgbK (DUF1537 family)
VREVTLALIDPHTEILIKKIDSTLRGNVVAETLAMLEASGRPTAIIAPAFPAQGRTVRGGIVHVNSVPLPQTGFARDALSPPPLQPLAELFRRACDLSVHAYSTPLPHSLANDHGIVVLDSEIEADLQAAIRALQGTLHQKVVVGSAGIAQAVCDVCFSDRQAPAAAALHAMPVLFVVGSRAQQSAAQVHALRELGAMVFDAPSGKVEVASVASCSAEHVIVRASAGSAERDAGAVAADLADGVAQLITKRSFAAMVATGGDTAIAILQRLSQPVLRVIGDLLPGIPYSRIGVPQGEMLFVTKAGGFGSADAFVTIARRLRSEPSSQEQPPTADLGVRAGTAEQKRPQPR